jgi:hypothetical protein
MFLPVMHGNTFWDYISDNNIPSTILKWPMTFQPKQNNAKLFAGLGVPDIKGGLGRYSFYTTKEISVSEEGAEKVVRVKFNGDTLKTDISGPNVAKMRAREEAKVNMNIKVLPDKSGAELDVDGKKISVRTGEWSEWVEVKFKLGMMKTTSGTIKFYLNEINPDLELYMTPVQINPNDPAFVITSPDEYIKELSREIGLFLKSRKKCYGTNWTGSRRDCLPPHSFLLTGYSTCSGQQETSSIHFMRVNTRKSMAMLLMTITAKWTVSSER